MNNSIHYSNFRRPAITVATMALLGLGAVASTLMQAAPGSSSHLAVEARLILAQTEGMERRQERRDDRQDCRQEEGLIGKDKRDCKQEGRSDDADAGADADNSEASTESE